MHPTRQLMRNNAGYTLIEIIGVLVIVSVMSMVAVDKFGTLQTRARQRAVDQAVEELRSRISAYFLESFLNGDLSVVPTETAIDTYLGDDFKVTRWLVTDTGVDVTIKYPAQHSDAGADFYDRSIRIPKTG